MSITCDVFAAALILSIAAVSTGSGVCATTVSRNNMPRTTIRILAAFIDVTSTDVFAHYTRTANKLTTCGWCVVHPIHADALTTWPCAANRPFEQSGRPLFR